MKNFDWDKFKGNERVCVHCKTEDEAKAFCKMMDDHGMKWDSGDSYLLHNNWNFYGRSTVYYGDEMYGDLDFTNRKNWTVLEFSDYFKGENRMEKNECFSKAFDILQDIANALDWKVTLYDDENIEFEKYSDLGEDFIFSISVSFHESIDDYMEEISEELYSYQEEFDTSEHADECYHENGSPADLQALLDDAVSIANDLTELSDACLEAVRKEEYKS